MRCMAEVLLHGTARLDCDRRDGHEDPLHRDSTHLVLWTDRADLALAPAQ